MTDDSVTRITLATDDGEQLEAELAVPDGASVGVVITHPHPTYGGSMHTPVPAELFRSARSSGAAALRFNFRGVGASSGTHDEGRAERLDVAAALATMADTVEGPLVLTGWSFGADVSLAVDHDRLVAWMPVAAPLAVVPTGEMAAPQSTKPKHLLVPEHDQFRPPSGAAEATANWDATTLEVVDGADHFFGVGLGTVGTALARLLNDL